jgi:hypothetical protein
MSVVAISQTIGSLGDEKAGLTEVLGHRQAG